MTLCTKKQRDYLLSNIDEATPDILKLVIRKYIEESLTKEDASKIIGRIVEKKRQEWILEEQRKMDGWDEVIERSLSEEHEYLWDSD